MAIEPCIACLQIRKPVGKRGKECLEKVVHYARSITEAGWLVDARGGRKGGDQGVYVVGALGDLGLERVRLRWVELRTLVVLGRR